MSGTVASGRGEPGDRYLLGNSTAEVEHLTSQAEVYAGEAAELLDRAGLAEGRTYRTPPPSWPRWSGSHGPAA